MYIFRLENKGPVFVLLHWLFALLSKMVFPGRFGVQEKSKQRAVCLNRGIIIPATPQGSFDFSAPAVISTHTLHN